MTLPEAIVAVGGFFAGAFTIIFPLVKYIEVKKNVPVNGNGKTDLKFKMLENNLNACIRDVQKTESKYDALYEKTIHQKKDVEHILKEIETIRAAHEDLKDVTRKDLLTFKISVEKQFEKHGNS